MVQDEPITIYKVRKSPHKNGLILMVHDKPIHNHTNNRKTWFSRALTAMAGWNATDTHRFSLPTRELGQSAVETAVLGNAPPSCTACVKWEFDREAYMATPKTKERKVI